MLEADLISAATKGDVAEVQRCLAAGGSVDCTLAEYGGATPLHRAAENGHKEVVALLLAAGAAVDASEYGYTPLHVAARIGRKVVVRLLLEAGAPVNAADKNGKTSLHFAAGNGHKEVVGLLLGGGAAVDATTKHGWTPLHWAARNGRTEMTGQLLAAGAAVDAADKDGWTPLHFAAGNGHKEVVGLLLAARAPVDATDKNGETPALVCCVDALEANKANKGAILAALAAAAAFKGPEPRRARNEEAGLHHPGHAAAADRLASSAYTWDVFISHAGRDADKPFALQLYRLLSKPGIGLRVFLDEPSLRVAEGAGSQMDEAMKSSFMALLLLSREFFERKATKYELDVLLQRQGLQRIKLLPVFLRMTTVECAAKLQEAFPGAEWPVGIRHQGEISSRPGNACSPKSEGETIEHIAKEVCKLCCGDGWEAWYTAGWNKLQVSIRS